MGAGLVRLPDRILHHHRTALGEDREFRGGYRMKAALPVLLLIAAVAQGDDQRTAGLQQLREDAEGPLALARWHVHPDGAKQHQVEAVAECAQAREFRQGVVEPGDVGVGFGYGQFTHTPAGFDGDDVPALLREPVGVAAGAGAYVAGEAGGRSSKLGDPSPMYCNDVCSLVLVCQSNGMLVIKSSTGH